MSPMPKGHEVRPLAERFWSKVDRRGPEDCWPWTGSVNEHGYGGLRVNGRLEKAHRVAYRLAHPDVELTPADHVCHKCDNPPCVNPVHLYVGDYVTNNADKVRRGRQSRGEERSRALAGKLPTGDAHWTHRDPERGTANADEMIRRNRERGPWNKKRHNV